MSSAAIAEIDQRLSRLIAFGVVESVDLDPPRVRVRFAGILSPALRFVSAAGDRATWAPPSVGEQVLIVCPSGDPAQGIVVGGVYSSSNPAPSTSADVTAYVLPNGDRLEHDAESGALQITVSGAVTVTADSAVVDASSIKLGGAAASDPVVRKSDLQAAINMIATALDTHMHPTAGVGPPSVATPAPSLTFAPATGSNTTSST